MNRELIISDPKLFGAKPHIAGTKITVDFVLDNMSVGRTPSELIAKNPELTEEAIRACKRFVLETVKRNDINTTRIPVRIRHLIVALEPDKLAIAISNAFQGERLGKGTSLRQMDIMSNYGQNEKGEDVTKEEFKRAKQLDEVNDWKAIVLDDLNRYQRPYFADAEAFRFYLPAQMIWELADNHNNSTPDNYSTWFFESADEWQLSLLNPLQKQAIARFLRRKIKINKKLFKTKDREDYEKAFANYWHQFL